MYIMKYWHYVSNKPTYLMSWSKAYEDDSNHKNKPDENGWMEMRHCIKTHNKKENAKEFKTLKQCHDVWEMIIKNIFTSFF